MTESAGVDVISTAFTTGELGRSFALSVSFSTRRPTPVITML
jgi:hypothetical protein